MQMSLEEWSVFLDEGAQETNTDPSSLLKGWLFLERKKKERQENERAEREMIVATRKAVEPKLTELYRNTGLETGRFDPKEILVDRLGLPDTHGNRMWVTRKLLSYREADKYRREGAKSCQTEDDNTKTNGDATE